MASDVMQVESVTLDLMKSDLLQALDAAADLFLVPPKPTARRGRSSFFMPFSYAIPIRPQENVVGVGIGYKLEAGRVTQHDCIQFYVAHKIAKSTLPARLRLPEEIHGVPTDVIETGSFLPLARPPSWRRRLRPARPGCSVGLGPSGRNQEALVVGTFGAIVELGGVRCILSNNHVLAKENRLRLGSPIFQPSLVDQGNINSDRIAQLTKFHPLTTKTPNTVDCAVAELLDDRFARPTFLSRVGGLKSSISIPAVRDMRVHKVGRSSGYTTGRVIGVTAKSYMPYQMGLVPFINQIVIAPDAGKPFCEPGDSGSVIVDQATGRPTGLLMAGASRGYGMANHMADVLSTLGTVVVT